MRCPFCGNSDTQVKDSRPAEENVAIRRRRYCPSCGGRFTTYERVQLRDLVVVKSNGRREDFDRDKLERHRSLVRDLEAAIGQSNVSIMRFSADGKVNDINDHGAERFGAKRSNIVGNTLDDYLMAEVTSAILERATRFLRDVEASVEFKVMSHFPL